MHKIALYSKHPKYTGFPETYTKAKNVYVWSEGKKYLDMCHHLGTNPLGYADSYVNHYVKQAIDQGNMSILNPVIDQKFSNLLLAIHPWADIVRFARTGGEAMKIAFDLGFEKLKKKENIVFCGYNGWHLKNVLNKYDNIISCNKINEIYVFKRPDILVFELARHEFPKSKTIELLKEWQREGTILVLDEITSGFRFCYGGVHLLYDLIPDICVFAKGISNGYPMAAIIGKEKYVESNLWISSTYWTSSIGSTAAYYTLKKLKHCDYRLLVKLGKSMKKIWRKCAEFYDIKIKISETDNICHFEFIDKSLECKSLFVQEMLKEDILASNQFYPSFAHKAIHITQYAKACKKVFEKIKKHLTGKEKFDINILEVLEK